MCNTLDLALFQFTLVRTIDCKSREAGRPIFSQAQRRLLLLWRLGHQRDSPRNTQERHHFRHFLSRLRGVAPRTLRPGGGCEDSGKDGAAARENSTRQIECFSCAMYHLNEACFTLCASCVASQNVHTRATPPR